MGLHGNGGCCFEWACRLQASSYSFRSCRLHTQCIRFAHGTTEQARTVMGVSHVKVSVVLWEAACGRMGVVVLNGLIAC